MNPLFIVFENDEWCHFVERIDSLAIVSFYCVCFVSFYLFLSFFVSTITCSVIEVSLRHLKYSSGVVLRFLSGVLRSELLT